jgi:hypothetical protein
MTVASVRSTPSSTLRIAPPPAYIATATICRAKIITSEVAILVCGPYTSANTAEIVLCPDSLYFPARK